MRLEEFRQSVLSLCMVDKQFLAVSAAILQPKYFELPAEQNLCRFILEHYKEFQKPPQKLAIRDRAYKYLNASAHLKNQLADFDVLLDLVSDMQEDVAEQSDYLQSRMIEFCREEALRGALISSVEAIKSGKLDEVLPKIEKALSTGSEAQCAGIYLLRDAENRKTITEARSGSLVPCGLQCIDEPMNGGIAKGELLIIMAPPNTGKTSILINIGVGMLKHRKKPVHISLEMHQGIIRAKYDQCLCRKTDAEFAAMDEEKTAITTRWMKSLHKNLGCDVYIKDFPSGSLTLDMLRAHLLMLRARDNFDFDALLLDYLDITKMPEHVREEYQQLAWWTIGLRRLGAELNCAVVTVTQTNREGSAAETARGRHVKGAFSKLADCDGFASMNQTDKEQEEDKARLFWEKTRLGRKGRTYDLMTDFERTLVQPYE